MTVVAGFMPSTLALSWTHGWLVASAYSLATSAFTFHVIRRLPLGLPRLAASLPILIGNALVPWTFDPATHTIGTGLLFCIITWLASFRLLMLCWGFGPYADPWVSARFARFAAVMSLPLRVRPIGARHVAAAPGGALPWLARALGVAGARPSASEDGAGAVSALAVRWALKTAALAALLRIYDYREEIGPLALHALHTTNLYIFITALGDGCGALAMATVRVDLDPVFDKPFLASSFRELWARRWNLLIGGLLRESVYEPIIHFLSLREMRKRKKRPSPVASSSVQDKETSHQGGVGPKPAADITVPPLLRAGGVMASFFVSGLMHEAAVYYLCYRVTGEMFLFFILHGVFVVCESAAMCDSEKVRRGTRGTSLSEIVVKGARIVFTVGISVLTAEYLFWAPILRYKVDLAVVEQIRNALGVNN